ncbi:hypothetical protein [Paenibacillus sp. 1001270B_150601_E10]|uniref:hypothetical protein n=1 Tax=Paenibacillus sp. 1001270B_150601_E10 TaxID=2787079 RepID=UPI00189E9533|nr:hypothetical protein [Paenibacillus sp. 1001270B_150601_E10]
MKNITFDEVFYITKEKGFNIVFFGKDDLLSVGLVRETGSSYEWIYGTGSKQFNESPCILTRSFANLLTGRVRNDSELVSLTFGVLNDNDIETLQIEYKDQKARAAAIVPTSKGRIWFCFSDPPIHADPAVRRIYQNGDVQSGWD